MVSTLKARRTTPEEIPMQRGKVALLRQVETFIYLGW